MRLAAFYIHEHHLFEGPQIVNLGGRNFYDFKFDDGVINIFIKAVNENMLEDFYHPQISLMSAIVGENGVGKTSLLKELILTFERFRNETLYDNIAFIYETTSDFKIYTSLPINNDLNKIQLPQQIKFEYYSPLVDLELKDISSGLNLSSTYNSTLEDFYLANLERQVLFNYSYISNLLKEKQGKNFPYIQGLIIKGKPQYKIDFEKPYALSDLQNQMGLSLKKLWLKYPNDTSKFDQFTHAQTNLVKDVEVNILALLIVNNTYPKVEGTGTMTYTIDEILDGNFEQALLKFKQHYINVLSTELYEVFINSNEEEFVIYLKNNFTGEPFDSYKSVYDVVELFRIIQDFYQEISNAHNEPGFTTDGDNLLFSNFDLDSEKLKSIQRVIRKYNSLLKVLEKTVLMRSNISLLEFSYYDFTLNKPQRLSTGEKALLNLFSSVYEYAKDSQHNGHKWENYIFLLDEADLGYHPEWKKKFISSIIDTLPVILSEIKSFKTLQIIFSTHDPLSLSDIPNGNIIYLKKEKSFTRILEIDDQNRPSRTFGANISDLLTDSFFVNDGLIGDFSKRKIEELIDELNALLEQKLLNQPINIFDDQKAYLRIRINIIDEPIIKNKLLEMYFSVFTNDINNEIEQLEARMNYLKSLNRND